MKHPIRRSLFPYKADSVVNFDSLSLMENSIETSEKLLHNRPPRDWPKDILEKVYEDYRVIDFDLIYNAFNI